MFCGRSEPPQSTAIKPYDNWRRRKRLSWSTVSDAVDMLSKISEATSPLSNCSRRHTASRRTAVSVEWYGQFAIWTQVADPSTANCYTCRVTDLSSGFDTAIKLEIVRWDLKLADSRPDFISVAMAILNASGNVRVSYARDMAIYS